MTTSMIAGLAPAFAATSAAAAAVNSIYAMARDVDLFAAGNPHCLGGADAGHFCDGHQGSDEIWRKCMDWAMCRPHPEDDHHNLMAKLNVAGEAGFAAPSAAAVNTVHAVARDVASSNSININCVTDSVQAGLLCQAHMSSNEEWHRCMDWAMCRTTKYDHHDLTTGLPDGVKIDTTNHNCVGAADAGHFCHGHQGSDEIWRKCMDWAMCRSPSGDDENGLTTSFSVAVDTDASAAAAAAAPAAEMLSHELVARKVARPERNVRDICEKFALVPSKWRQCLWDNECPHKNGDWNAIEAFCKGYEWSKAAWNNCVRWAKCNDISVEDLNINLNVAMDGASGSGSDSTVAETLSNGPANKTTKLASTFLTMTRPVPSATDIAEFVCPPNLPLLDPKDRDEFCKHVEPHGCTWAANCLRDDSQLTSLGSSTLEMTTPSPAPLATGIFDPLCSTAVPRLSPKEREEYCRHPRQFDCMWAINCGPFLANPPLPWITMSIPAPKISQSLTLLGGKKEETTPITTATPAGPNSVGGGPQTMTAVSA